MPQSLSRFGRAMIGLMLAYGIACAGAQAQQQPNNGAAQFVCDDGSRLTLEFGAIPGGVAALVTVLGAAYELPARDVPPGPVRLEWANGPASLTWSPGVQLMWMNGPTHLMCGRGGHKH